MNNGNMQKRMIVALIFSIVLLVVFQYFFGPEQTTQKKQVQPNTKTQKTVKKEAPEEQKPKETQKKESFKQKTKEFKEESIKKLLTTEPKKAVGYKYFENN